MMMVRIETDRLLLRPISAGDAGEVFAYRRDALTNQYQGWVPENLESVRDFIAKNPETFNRANTWFQLVIQAKDRPEILGDAGLHFVGDDQLEIGCTLNKAFHGRGYASEALRAVLDFAFGELGKHRVFASLDPRNTPSVQLMERLGFRREAHFLKSYYFKGEWVDDVVYALLRDEWNTTRPGI